MCTATRFEIFGRSVQQRGHKSLKLFRRNTPRRRAGVKQNAAQVDDNDDTEAVCVTRLPPHPHPTATEHRQDLGHQFLLPVASCTHI